MIRISHKKVRTIRLKNLSVKGVVICLVFFIVSIDDNAFSITVTENRTFISFSMSSLRYADAVDIL